MPRDSTTLTFVIVGEETPIYECEIKAGAKVRQKVTCWFLDSKQKEEKREKERERERERDGVQDRRENINQLTSFDSFLRVLFETHPFALLLDECRRKRL